MIEVGLRMKSGGMKKKTKTGNHWESLARGGESEGSKKTEKSERDETEEDMTIVLEDVNVNGRRCCVGMKTRCPERSARGSVT